ncbi:MAG: DUF3592 domain-containing protein [Pseudomonadota bacterium]
MPLFLQWFIILFCSIFLLIGIGIAYESYQFARWGEAAEAEITSIRQSVETRSRDTGSAEQVVTDWPTVRYTTRTGDTYEAEVEVTHEYGDRSIGDWVRVLYLPESPTRVRLARGFSDLWIAPIAFILMGSLFTFGVFFFFRYSNRRERERYRKKYGIDP